MSKRSLKVVSGIVVLLVSIAGCGDTSMKADLSTEALESQWEDEESTPYPDEAWDPGPAPWEDCMEGYGSDCEDMYGSGSAGYNEGSPCEHGVWDPEANEGIGGCSCDVGYTSENCSTCDTGYIMTQDGCVSE